MDNEQIYYTIILRHDTSTQWAVNNPILMAGEYGVEDDTHRVKRGDGKTSWNELTYEHFGLEFIVTFGNLLGDIDDNAKLKAEFDDRITKSSFENSNNMLVTDLTITDVDGEIGKITKTKKNVLSGSNSDTYLYIRSSDHSIQGTYSIDANGAKILNLQAESTIENYTPDRWYYADQLCFYKNKLYRANEMFQAGTEFNESQWTVIASQIAKDIIYDNKISKLEATNVKDAIDEVVDLDSKKVKQTQRENKIYGTDEYGEQHLYDKDSLRTVDTVNGVHATPNKNIQIDASDINYDDDAAEVATIKEVLDSKVDKTVAGKGSRIVKDVVLTYNEENGALTLKENKLSLEDGSTNIETTEVNVVSNQELEELSDTINDRIDTEVATLNNTITTKETTINNRIDNEVQTLNDRVDEEVETLNTKIDQNTSDLNRKIDNNVTNLQNQITTNATEITRVETERTTEDTRIENESKQRDNNLNTQINNAVNTLNNTILHQVEIIENRITTEVDTINDTIDNLEIDITGDVDAKVQTLNNRIDDEVDTLNNRIDTEVQTLNNTITTKETQMDNKKIDKDIATGLVSEIVAATESNEPTLKITTKNTTTKTPTVSHLHFKAQGQIQTKFQDADHIVIDSTNIDNKNNQQDERLVAIEDRLDTHDQDIADLYTHDTTHDRLLGQQANLIQNNTHSINDLNTAMDGAQADISRLQTQTTTQETHLTRHDNDIADLNDGLVATNRNVSANTADIADLRTNKANKTFAERTNNKVVGTITTNTLENNEIIRLDVTSVDPSTEMTSNSILKVISSDNTIVATRDRDTGVIDLKTNLDTDVNYFVTTEILDTTIPSENIIPLNTLTPTDKVDVEVHDIISDPEGTWARVLSINTTLQTCVAVTFKRHAQAVWGTIKGNILDQQDLQEQFNDLDTNFQNALDEEIQARELADQNEETARTNADNILQDNINNEETARTNADTSINNRIDNLTSDQIQVLTTQEKEEGGYPDSSIKQALYNIQSVISQNSYVQGNRIKEYIQGNYYEATCAIYDWDVNNNNVYTSYTINNYVTFDRDDGVVLMAKIMNDFTSDNTQSTTYESFIYDVEIGNLRIVGIPEEVGEYTPPTPEPNWNLVRSININSITSDDEQHPSVNIYEDIDQTGPSCGIEIVNNSSTQELNISGYISAGISAGNSIGILNDYAYTPEELQSEQDILNIMNFEFVNPGPEPSATSSVRIHFVDINNNYINIAETVGSSSLQRADDPSIYYYPVTGWEYEQNFEDIPTGYDYIYSSSHNDYDITTTSILVDEGIDDQTFNILVTPKSSPEPEDAAETFDVLNQVAGTQDAYEGMGGTEEEVEAVLDEILGASENPWSGENYIGTYTIPVTNSEYNITAYLSETDDTQYIDFVNLNNVDIIVGALEGGFNPGYQWIELYPGLDSKITFTNDTLYIDTTSDETILNNLTSYFTVELK